MIRSLAAQKQIEGQDEPPIRRNLERENLETALRDGEMLWMDIVSPSKEEIDWLADQLNLNPVIVNDLLSVDLRPTLLIYPTYLFLSLFQPVMRRNAVFGEEVHCLIGDNYFITVHQPDSTAVDEAYNRAAKNHTSWQRGIAYFLYLTCQHVIDAYYPLLDRMSNQLDGLEEKLLANGVDVVGTRKTVYRIKQQLIKLRQMVAPQREVLSNVIGEQRVAQNEDIRDLFRHLYERLLRIYDVIDSQRDLSSNVMDMMENQESRTLVEAVNRLTILSMIFLPLTFLAGLFELNFVTIPDAVALPISGSVMFVVVIGAMISSAVVMIIIFRRKGWL